MSRKLYLNNGNTTNNVISTNTNANNIITSNNVPITVTLSNQSSLNNIKFSEPFEVINLNSIANEFLTAVLRY